MMRSTMLVGLLALATSPTILAFQPVSLSRAQIGIKATTTTSSSSLNAGGFEWEDPGDAAFDQGVENPFKNPELMKNSEDGMKIDPARLLGPRLNGSNLYLIGMMGTGKSTVGDIVARRKFMKKLMV